MAISSPQFDGTYEANGFKEEGTSRQCRDIPPQAKDKGETRPEIVSR